MSSWHSSWQFATQFMTQFVTHFMTQFVTQCVTVRDSLWQFVTVRDTVCDIVLTQFVTQFMTQFLEQFELWSANVPSLINISMCFLPRFLQKRFWLLIWNNYVLLIKHNSDVYVKITFLLRAWKQNSNKLWNVKCWPRGINIYISICICICICICKAI